MRSFSEQLKAAMKEAGLNQVTLANMVGVSKGSMNGYFSGKVDPPKKKKE